MNGDGRVTSKDLQLLKKYMADAVGEDEIVYANSDINADNRITSKDVNLLKAILAS